MKLPDVDVGISCFLKVGLNFNELILLLLEVVDNRILFLRVNAWLITAFHSFYYICKFQFACTRSDSISVY